LLVLLRRVGGLRWRIGSVRGNFKRGHLYDLSDSALNDFGAEVERALSLDGGK
jgi:hypothetical protein